MAVPEIDVDELARLREGDVVLIDVRQEAEFEDFHVAGAQLIPLDQLVERAEEIPTDRKAYVICLTGSRSGRAVEFLNAQGYDTVNVVGGCKAWLEADFPVEHGLD